ncbi:MAG: GxxExxY protein [Candidatus Moranbacteria bacterium]|nr:GxxExxY protein [Candidatus Moranbacteria bacterium]
MNEYQRIYDEFSQITNDTNKILEKELCYKIQGCIYNVSNKYGRGLKENIYQKALAEEFAKNNLTFNEQKRINIFSFDTGKKLGTYIPDFLVENKVIIEIKASNFTMKQDIEQQRSYLRISEYEIGYLVNFCTPKLEMKRSIYTNDKKPFIRRINTNIKTNQDESRIRAS